VWRVCSAQEKYGFKARVYHAAGFETLEDYKKVHGSDLFIRDVEEYDRICKARAQLLLWLNPPALNHGAHCRLSCPLWARCVACARSHHLHAKPALCCALATAHRGCACRRCLMLPCWQHVDVESSFSVLCRWSPSSAR
jgi:hypothetical protein